VGGAANASPATSRPIHVDKPRIAGGSWRLARLGGWGG
jgi:hypothetical protein